MKLGWVLGRHDEEGTLEDAGRALDGHLALPHRLEQRGLGPRRGAVYLVGQHDVGEDRTRDELEAHVFLVEDARPGDVGRKQVGRALDAAEGATHRGGERAGEHRLAGAGEILQQYVTAGNEAGQGEPYDVLFADDDPVDVAFDAIEQLGGAPGLEGGFLHWRSSVESGWRGSAR